LRAGLVTAPFSYRSELSGDAADYAPEAAFQMSPAFGSVGLDLQAEAWFGPGTFGVAARMLGLMYRVQLGEEKYGHASADLSLDGRWRAWEQGDIAAYALLGATRTGGFLFSYANEARTEALLVDYPLYGGRAGGGLRFERGGLLGQLELAETFAPFPVYSRADLGLDIPLSTDLLAVHVGAGVAARHMTFAIEDTSSMKIRQTGWDLGVGISFLAF
jgi:hypothetical protein